MSQPHPSLSRPDVRPFRPCRIDLRLMFHRKPAALIINHFHVCRLRQADHVGICRLSCPLTPATAPQRPKVTRLTAPYNAAGRYSSDGYDGGAARYGATYGRAPPPRKQAERSSPGRFGREVVVANPARNGTPPRGKKTTPKDIRPPASTCVAIYAGRDRWETVATRRGYA